MVRQDIRRALFTFVSVAALLAPSSAHADETIDSGVWDNGDASASCGAGANTRTCTYGISWTNCTEASMSTGAGPRVVVPCDLTMSAHVTVQPRVNAAGRVVGCTSVVGTTVGTATFESGVSTSWNRTIPLHDITVQSGTADQSNAVVKFVGEATNGTMAWTVRGTLTGTSCAPSKTTTALAMEGSVTVAGRTPQ